VGLVVFGAIVGGSIVSFCRARPVSPTEPASAADENTQRKLVIRRPPRIRIIDTIPPTLHIPDAGSATARVPPDFSCQGEISARCPFLQTSPELLREMARCGAVRFDMPTMNVAAYRVDDREKELIAAVIDDYKAKSARELGDVAASLAVPVSNEKDLFETMRSVESTMNAVDSDQALRQLAKERAGLRPVGTPGTGAPAERYWRFKADLGDRFEQALAAQLGAYRARQLRQMKDGWPMKSVVTGECREN
jgi:hypothetical protein